MVAGGRQYETLARSPSLHRAFGCGIVPGMNARVLSGIQPSGVKHLGNYFGAIRQHIELQERFAGECFYFIADYHALTTLQNAEALRDSVRELAVTYLALGLDPEKALLFRQSDVPEVTELAWLLATVTGMGLLALGVGCAGPLSIMPRSGSSIVVPAADMHRGRRVRGQRR